MSSVSCGLSPLVGSSMSRSFGARASALAISRRRCSASDSSAASTLRRAFEAGLLQRLLDAVRAAGLVDARDVVGNRHGGEQANRLERAGDAAPGDVVHGGCGDVASRGTGCGRRSPAPRR